MAQFLRSLPDEVASWKNLSGAEQLRLAKLIEARLGPLEASQADVDAAVKAMQAVALTRINEVLGPAIASVQAIQASGFMIANSSTEAELAEGATIELVIQDEDERALFTPSPWPALTRQTSADEVAVTRLIDYDKETGAIILQVVQLSGEPGIYDDWTISATAGVAYAAALMLASAEAARDTAIGARDTAIGARDTAIGARDTAVAYANSAEDIEISAGVYSAKHWAAKALASALAAATFDPSTYYTKTESDGLYATPSDLTDLANDLAGDLAGGIVGVKLITATGTYNRSAGATKALVFCVQGGQAGGGSSACGSSGAVRVGVVSPGATESVTIGAAGSAPSGNGGHSSFGSLMSSSAGGSFGFAARVGTTGVRGGDTAFGFGQGGVGSSGPGTATAGAGFGAGGGSSTSGAQAGAPGCILVVEFK